MSLFEDTNPRALKELLTEIHSRTTVLPNFQRDFDALFDELLIGPWRAPASENEPAMVLEREHAYEVRLCTGALKPSDLEVVVSENHLTVKARDGETLWERLVNFANPVQTDKVTARWAERILTVIAPKEKKATER